MLEKMREQEERISPQEMNKTEILAETEDWDTSQTIQEMMDQLGLSDNFCSDERRIREIFAKLCKIKVNNNMYRKALNERDLLVVDGELNGKRFKHGKVNLRN